MKTKNLCAKTRKMNQPYEIWAGSGFVYLVLKKYQTPEMEASNPYARWFVAGKSDMTFGTYEMGDMYVKEIKSMCSLVWVDGNGSPMPDINKLKG